VATDELVHWAEEQAISMLSGLGNRLRHVQAVAERARQVGRRIFDDGDRATLIAAAYLHDIGYAPTLSRLGFHPVDGARYVRAQGHERLASLVAYHSGARFEAEERGLADELAEFEPRDGPLMDALIYADMTTGPAGQDMAFEERIAEILGRYAAEDPVHRAITRSAPVLGAAVDRTRKRLAETGQTSHDVGCQAADC
jgi:hypothetical protein